MVMPSSLTWAMASSSLTSNSFLFPTPTPAPSKTSRRPSRIALAKLNSPFRIGPKKDDGSVSESEEPTKTPRFSFDFGKIPDVRSLVPVVNQPSVLGNLRGKDPRTVFVAGATGQAGVRIAQTLLRKGFAVRAGVPELSAAQELARIAAQYKFISSQEFKRLNAVESGYQDPESIAKAIGNAGKVVITIGPSENGPTSPFTISDALQVVQAAQLASVGHMAIIYDSSFTSPGSTYNVLDGISSFFSNIFAKSQPLSLPEFLGKVVETDVSYTLIKARLTDDFSPEYSKNVVVAPEGDTNVYKVSKSQIASVVADVFSNTSVAENKVVELSTDPSAPSKTTDELFSAIPEDGRRKAYAESLAKAKAEEEALVASERAQKAAVATKKLQVEVKKLAERETQASVLAKEAQEKAKTAGASLDSLLNRAKGMSSEFSWDKLSSQITNTVAQKIDELPKTQIATVRGVAKARRLTPKKAVIKQSAPKPKAKTKPEKETQGSQPEVRNVFGGLFKQEVIYVDDD